MAFTLAPALCSLLLTGQSASTTPRWWSILKNRYLALLNWGLRRAWLVIGIAILLAE